MTTEERLDFAAGEPEWTTVIWFRRAVTLGTAGAAVVALAGLLGYLPGLRILGSIRPTYIPMAPSTAGCFLILGVALFGHSRRPWQGAGLVVMFALVLSATFFGLLKTVEYYEGIDLHLDGWLAPGAGALGDIPIGRMSPITGTAFGMAGLGTCLLLLRPWGSRHTLRLGSWASSLGILTMLVGISVLLSYVYGTPFMYSGAQVPMAATTAIAFLFLGVALVAAVGPESFLNNLDKINLKLRQSEERHRTILQMAMDGIWLADKHGRLLEVNEAYCRMSGYSARELLAMRMSDLEVGERLHETAARLKTCMEQGKARFESQHRRKDGSVFAVEISVLYQTTEGGQFVYFLQDITERKKAEAQVQTLLEESNQARLALLGILEEETRAKADLKRLSVAIEQAAEAIVVTDAQGLIQYINPAFETVTGYTRAEAIGQNSRMLKSGMQDGAFYRDMWGIISGGKTWNGRFINRRKNGSLYTEEAIISPVRDAAGVIINYVAVKRDITEQLGLEGQLYQARKMEAVGRLAGGVAHDFNNILQAILGFTQLATDSAAPGTPIRRDLDEIQSAARRAADLTRQLLAFARKQTITPRIINLNENVEGLLKMARRLIGENIELAWAPQANLWPVRMDPSQVDQILVNLCINARDAIGSHGVVHIATDNVRVDEIQAVRHDDFHPGDYVLLTVSDTGCGMDGETLAHIFEPFFTTKEFGHSAGLGLATVEGIVRQNKGHIGVYSEPGKGTIFRIHFPRYLGADVGPVVEAPEKPLARGSETVLVVEDDVVILNMVSRMLQGLGYTVLTAGLAEAALRIAEKHAGEIQLLVTDVIMPGMNGREMAEKLMASRPSLKCLFMSGFTADVIARQGVLIEGVQFIQKPFSLDKLAAKVREALA